MQADSVEINHIICVLHKTITAITLLFNYICILYNVYVFLFSVVKMTEDQPEKTPVKLHIYDLTKGMARSMSPLFLGILFKIDF